MPCRLLFIIHRKVKNRKYWVPLGQSREVKIEYWDKIISESKNEREDRWYKQKNCKYFEYETRETIQERCRCVRDKFIKKFEGRLQKRRKRLERTPRFTWNETIAILGNCAIVVRLDDGIISMDKHMRAIELLYINFSFIV